MWAPLYLKCKLEPKGGWENVLQAWIYYTVFSASQMKPSDGPDLPLGCKYLHYMARFLKKFTGFVKIKKIFENCLEYSSE